MININSVKVGDEVHYAPGHLEAVEYENGIVKEVPDQTSDITKDKVRVVYNCGDDWENYREYTAALTDVKDLRRGWIRWKS